MQSDIHVTTARDTVRVTFDDLVLEGAVGTTTEAFLKKMEAETGPFETPPMGAIVNGELRELNYPITIDSNVSPILLTHGDGRRIYRRTLVFLLTTVAHELWPDCRISVRYAVPDGGFYCTRLCLDPFTPHELELLEQRMCQVVEEDAPITKRVVPLEEAEALFKSRNEADKLRLLEQRDRPELVLYRLRGHDDYYYGYMLPSTGLLKYFRLIWVREGFILQYPRTETPTQLRPLRAYDKLSHVFHQTDEWLDRMEVQDIGKLNRIVRDHNRLHELVLVAEALHEQNIAHIAGEICRANQDRGVRLVLIAGPTSSGKTTFSKRLAIQILAHGLKTFTLELDNYFVDRDLTPLDENGEYDFEALGAVNLELFNAHLLKLFNNEPVQLPRFDFHTGKSVPGLSVQLNKKQIVIIEGIHGMNPALVPHIPAERLYRVYVSALTQLNVDAHNRVTTTDVRMLRRIVRDARRRNYSATETLLRWPSVRRGEKRNIFPYQENADIMFNSALPYELTAIRPLAEPLLFQVTPGQPPHIEAKRLLSFLRWVRPMQPEQQEFIPDTSLLREFVGNSSLNNYHPGRLIDDE